MSGVTRGSRRLNLATLCFCAKYSPQMAQGRQVADPHCYATLSGSPTGGEACEDATLDVMDSVGKCFRRRSGCSGKFSDTGG